MPRFVTLARTADLSPGQGKVINAGPLHIALFNVGGSFYAIDNNCPHALGPLGVGDLDDRIVSCPLHGWTFDVTTGLSAFMPGVRVRTFPVRVEGDQVQVELD